MNLEAVEEMIHRRQLLHKVIHLMKEGGEWLMDTPDGPVSRVALQNEARFIDMMLIDELDELPISGILINLLK